jgi:hypothetical protein
MPPRPIFRENSRLFVVPKNDCAKKESRETSGQSRKPLNYNNLTFFKFCNFVAKKRVTPTHLSSGIAQPSGGA